MRITSTKGSIAARWDRPGVGSSSSVVTFSGSTLGGTLENVVEFLRFGSKNKHS